MKTSWAWLGLFGLLGACTAARPKYQFADGFYRLHTPGQPAQRTYVANDEALVRVYPVDKVGRATRVDTASAGVITLGPQWASAATGRLASLATGEYRFSQPSLDVDFLTIPFKFRPALATFPRQFNTNLSGAVFVGLRNDVYRLRYGPNPLGQSVRRVTHYGVSVGGFMGLGGTAINPSVTNGQVTFDYDGVVWSKGVAVIVGVNNFTLGLALGWDDLLDQNHPTWAYQRQPWLGLAFGLNLN